jgi:hypothetical protein
MKTIGWGVLFALLVSFGAERKALAQPADVSIVDFTYAGTGCTAGDVNLSLSDGMDAVFVQFDSLVARTPPGSLDRKNCQIAIKLRFDPEWSFSIPQVTYKGYADIKTGTFGQQKTTYFFQGVPPAGDVSAQTTLHGPFIGDYARSDHLGLALWSPCGGSSQTLVINAQVRVQGPDGQMTVDSIFRKTSQEYGLLWRKCP